MARGLGVLCKSCKNGIDLGDEYVAAGGKKVDFPNMAWRQTLACPNPACGHKHEYKGDDLIVHGG